MPGPNDKSSVVDAIDELDGTDYGDNNDIDTDVDNQDEGDDGGADEVDDRTTQGPSQQENNRSSIQESKRGAKDFTKTNAADSKAQGKLQRLHNGTHVDAKGNIVDPRDGTILARAGAEARHFNNSQRFQREVTAKDTEITQLKTQLQQAQVLNGAPQQLGLDQEDLRVGLPLIKEFKTNPTQAARRMVEMVVGMGYNVTDILGKDAANAVEVGGIKQMLDQALQPLRAQQEQAGQAARQTAQTRQAEQAVRQFFDQNEHAELHATAIDRLIGQHPEMSPEKAYYEIRRFADANGLDFSRPLQPQLDALQQRGGQQNQNPRQRRALPNGNNGGEMNNQPIQGDGGIKATDSWDKILRRTMQNVGSLN